MVKNDFKEKRQFSRAQVVSLVVIRCDILANVRDQEPLEFHTHTENMSEGGMNVILNEELQGPAVLELKLYLTGKIMPIVCKGRVAWTKAISPPGINPGIFSTGISFIDLRESDKESIREIVACFSD